MLTLRKRKICRLEKCNWQLKIYQNCSDKCFTKTLNMKYYKERKFYKLTNGGYNRLTDVYLVKCLNPKCEKVMGSAFCSIKHKAAYLRNEIKQAKKEILGFKKDLADDPKDTACLSFIEYRINQIKKHQTLLKKCIISKSSKENKKEKTNE